MKTIRLPYGKTHLDLNIDEEKLAGIIYPPADNIVMEGTEKSVVENSIKNPIGSRRLCELAAGAGKVLVITSDHTRPVPSKITLPILLEEIRKSNPHVEIKIIVATGLHRTTTREELIDKFGHDIVDKEDIVIHDCRDKNNLVFKGILPSGGELWLNSLVDWADLLVAEGFIEPHFFAGYSGGRKSVLPGIAGEKTVLANHCSAFISNINSRAGNLKDNPLHEDMLYAAGAAKLRFILNVALNSEKKIIGCFCGDAEEAHKEGCEFVSRMSRAKAVPSDIVIVTNGGYPLDQNIYQAVKGLDTASRSIKEDGTIIMLAECEDGHGGESFYKWFKNGGSPEEVVKKIAAIPMEDTSSDQWQAQVLARILVKYRVIMVTDKCGPELVNDLFMLHANSLDEALGKAYGLSGRDANVTVIPDGVSIVVEQ